MTITKNDIVTCPFDNSVSSNTFVVDEVVGSTAILKHPLLPEVLVRKNLADLNKVGPNLKDSTERSLDFAKNNIKYLDYNTSADLEALCLYFVFKRKLTPRQKGTLSNTCGFIASIKLNNDIKEAMDLIKRNEGILDEFNAMWYRNFKNLFIGRQQITSKKQRSAIFNIAGFIMAELETPSTAK